MNQLKNILLKLHGENKTNLRKLYVDKHVFDSGVRSSERFVEDERIYTYHELQFRFVGTGMRHPERMNLLVFLPKRFVTDGEPEREPENGLYAAYEDYLLRKLAPRIAELSQELENDRKDSREKAKFEVQTTNECILRRNGMVYDAAGKSFVLRILLHMSLITGGGYSGKSTLLDALESGIYHHIPGDGREYVISLPSTSKIYAEDGRIVHDMDMTMFFQQGMAELFRLRGITLTRGR